MENSQKRRAWFQIHLSTAIALMFLAGPIIFSNVNFWRKREKVWVEMSATIEGKPGWYYALSQVKSLGWPFIMREDSIECNFFTVARYRRDSPKIWTISRETRWQSSPPTWDVIHVALNVAASFSVLLLFAIGFEWVTRRNNKARAIHL